MRQRVESNRESRRPANHLVRLTRFGGNDGSAKLVQVSCDLSPTPAYRPNVLTSVASASPEHFRPPNRPWLQNYEHPCIGATRVACLWFEDED
jgi:hypothetical protein